MQASGCPLSRHTERASRESGPCTGGAEVEKLSPEDIVWVPGHGSASTERNRFRSGLITLQQEEPRTVGDCADSARRQSRATGKGN